MLTRARFLIAVALYMPCPITRTTHCRLRAVNTFGKTPDDMGVTETEGDARAAREEAHAGQGPKIKPLRQ